MAERVGGTDPREVLMRQSISKATDKQPNGVPVDRQCYREGRSKVQGQMTLRAHAHFFDQARSRFGGLSIRRTVSHQRLAAVPYWRGRGGPLVTVREPRKDGADDEGKGCFVGGSSSQQLLLDCCLLSRCSEIRPKRPQSCW